MEDLDDREWLAPDVDSDGDADDCQVAAIPKDREAAGVLAIISTIDEAAIVAANPTVRQSRSQLKLPCSQNQTKDQQWMAAARMRDRKHVIQVARMAVLSKEMVAEAFDRLREAGLLRDGGKSKIKLSNKNVIAITLPGCKQPTALPCKAILEMTYSEVKSRADVARAFKIDPKTVTKFACLTAAASEKADEDYLLNFGDSFMTDEPLVYVVALAADATANTFCLPMVGMEEHKEATRSNWHVMVSSCRVSITRKGESIRFEATRPNVAVVGTENGETIYASLYTVAAVKSQSDMDLKGLAAAKYPFMHFDLDGLPSNLRGVAIRRCEVREKTGKNVPTSVFHCGSHTTCLTENQTVVAMDNEGIYTLLQALPLFFNMGGNFLRLVQSCGPLFDDLVPRPVAGSLSPLDEEVIGELRGYYENKYKRHIQHV